MSASISTDLRPGSLAGWSAMVVSALIVLLTGSRLVVLGMQQQATATRGKAQLLADHAAAAIQAQLQTLGQRARQRAQLFGATTPSDDSHQQSPAMAAKRNAFWLLSDGSVQGVAVGDQEAAKEIASSWSAQKLPTAALHTLGPMREGGRWIVALLAPSSGALPGGNRAWAVVYRDLDSVLLGAHLDAVARAGFDFELSRWDPTMQRSVAVTGAVASPMTNPTTSSISLPGDGPQTEPWLLSVAPRAGWFPLQTLVVDLSLLLLATWLVALSVRDATRHMANLRTALAVSRRRLQNAHRRLSQEIDQRQRLQKSLEHAHQHDALTGLPNRHYLVGQLDRALRDMRTRPGLHVALLLIRVDRFNIITDTVGHTAGDELMVQLARQFAEALPAQEHVLARWSEDEFGLLCSDVRTSDDMLGLARSIEAALRAPIELRRHRVSTAVTVGGTYVESGLQRTEEVLREADIALSTAKPQGGSSVVVYSAALQDKLLQFVSLQADLQMALEHDEFRVLFQPIVELRSRRIVGVEALLRWLHPVEGLLGPNRFLGLAEEAGLIVPITRWVIRHACAVGAQWRPRLPPNYQFYISINLSPSALLDVGLCSFVRQVLDETGLPASCLKFELTENGLISNVSAVRDVLDTLHEMGIGLILDDFGTGYSSLSHLQLFPLGYIKLDGHIDTRFGPEGAHGALLRAMVQMARTLGLRTIAEMVETPSAVKILEQIGCEFVQGNAFCEPIDAEQLVRRLRSPVLELREVEEEPNDSPTLILPILSETNI